MGVDDSALRGGGEDAFSLVVLFFFLSGDDVAAPGSPWREEGRRRRGRDLLREMRKGELRVGWLAGVRVYVCVC